MKLQDIEVGMRVHDQYGNQYAVHATAPTDAQCALLYCVFFVHPMHVGNGVYFERIGQAWWIVQNQACVRHAYSLADCEDNLVEGHQKWLLVDQDKPLEVDITLETLEVTHR